MLDDNDKQWLTEQLDLMETRILASITRTTEKALSEIAQKAAAVK